MPIILSNTMDIHIKEVPIDDLASAMNIISLAIEHMEKNGIHQWDSVYPDEATIEEDCTLNELWGAYHKTVLIGIMALNEHQEEEYRQIDWEFPDSRPLVMHRLCIHPDYQGKGIAKRLALFAEEFAKEKNCDSIRLDAFVHNPSAYSLYRKLGYIERGSVQFRKGEFFCFEKAVI